LNRLLMSVYPQPLEIRFILLVVRLLPMNSSKHLKPYSTTFINGMLPKWLLIRGSRSSWVKSTFQKNLKPQDLCQPVREDKIKQLIKE
jgi:hypothetical protein